MINIPTMHDADGEDGTGAFVLSAVLQPTIRLKGPHLKGISRLQIQSLIAIEYEGQLAL